MYALVAALGFVLVVAALPKLGAPEAFGRTVEAYRLMPRGLAHMVGRVLPPVELVLGVLLVTGRPWTISTVTATALFAAFSAGLTINLMRGRTELSCGCFSFGAVDTEASHISWWHAGRAAALALASGVAAVVGSPGSGPAVQVPQLVVAAAVVAAGVMLAETRALVHDGAESVDAVLVRAQDRLRAVGTRAT